MANNKVKQIWASGKAVVNAWLAIPSGFSAEVIAQCGFDSVTVDMQHGVQDYQSMVQCFQAMHAHPVTPMVRVPWNTPGDIMKALDAGAYGIICPMVNSRAECEAFVGACRYPPAGYRSFGPTRAALVAGPRAEVEQVIRRQAVQSHPVFARQTIVKRFTNLVMNEAAAPGRGIPPHQVAVPRLLDRLRAKFLRPL